MSSNINNKDIENTVKQRTKSNHYPQIIRNETNLMKNALKINTKLY